MSKEINNSDKNENNPVAKIVEGAETEISQEMINKVMNVASPLFSKAGAMLDGALGDDEKVIIIKKVNKNGPAVVFVLDNTQNFELKGGKENSFTGDKKAIIFAKPFSDFTGEIAHSQVTKLSESIVKQND